MIELMCELKERVLIIKWSITWIEITELILIINTYLLQLYNFCSTIYS